MLSTLFAGRDSLYACVTFPLGGRFHSLRAASVFHKS